MGIGPNTPAVTPVMRLNKSRRVCSPRKGFQAQSIFGESNIISTRVAFICLSSAPDTESLFALALFMSFSSETEGHWLQNSLLNIPRNATLQRHQPIFSSSQRKASPPLTL